LCQRVSLGRNYDGTRVGEGFTAPGLEEPVVYWVPVACPELVVYRVRVPVACSEPVVYLLEAYRRL